MDGGGSVFGRNRRGRFLSKRRATRRATRQVARKAATASVTVGSKAQVWHGTAKHTSGGLERKDLMKTRKGRIVSKKKHTLGKKALSRLHKAGYKAKKGSFKLFH